MRDKEKDKNQESLWWRKRRFVGGKEIKRETRSEKDFCRRKGGFGRKEDKGKDRKRERLLWKGGLRERNRKLCSIQSSALYAKGICMVFCP